MSAKPRDYNQPYSGENLNRVAFPLGGIGAGMICLEGTGALSHVSLRNAPSIFNEPQTFSAISVRGEEPVARVLEGPVPRWKAFGEPGTGNGAGGKTWGLPRFGDAVFSTAFPFSSIELSDAKVPLNVRITGWSPFIPGDSHNSSLPCAALEFTFKNTSSKEVDAVYSFNSVNFMRTHIGGDEVKAGPGKSVVFYQPGNEKKPWDQGAFCAAIADEQDTQINYGWFRGGWWDPLTMVWKDVDEGKCYSKPPYSEGPASPGATLFVPFKLGPGAEKTIKVLFSWYCPVSDMRHGDDPKPVEGEESCCCSGPCDTTPETYSPYYSSQFDSIEAVAGYWEKNYDDLQERSAEFRDAFYDTTLPAEVVEAVAANMTILKSPTVLRQHDGRLWAWEGCHDASGCCSGSCTHVWNYAQALPHLFPDLERTLRETEFNWSQDDRGHQTFRSALPIRPVGHQFHAASDGQLGGVMKAYREWRISGDTEWLRGLWDRIKQSLNYCIQEWDPDHWGVLREPHHNTYDIEFWGPDGMCTSFYLGALQAASEMEKALGDEQPLYQELLKKGCEYMENELFDGEYFFQKVMMEGLKTPPPVSDPNHPPEAVELMKTEGPKYQYGKGCLSDGILGAWIAAASGVPEFLDKEKVRSMLHSIHKYNLKTDLSEHANPQRPSYAFGKEGGLLLCTWPKGGKLSLPCVYGNEVWTGIEYQVASHLMMEGLVEEGLEIVRVCRDRYDGTVRNPFNEYECGHWYARAMSSYGLLQGLSGARYDAITKTLVLKPSIKGDFHSFLSTATGYATVGVKDGKPFVDVRSGSIDIQNIDYTPAE